MVSSVVVARSKADGLEYLAQDERIAWTSTSNLARRYQNVREATRAAMRTSRYTSAAFAMAVNMLAINCGLL